MKKPLVGIVLGSDSDFDIVKDALAQLDEFDIPYELTVSSAHRSPARTHAYAADARDRGIEVIIAAAGWAAHLAGVIASETRLPVIGIPLESSPLNGLDALLSTAQMPGGVPVATMALGSQGARNAAVFAAQILALKYPEIDERLAAFKHNLENKVAAKDQALKNKIQSR